MTSIWFPNIKYPPNTKNYLPCFVLGGGGLVLGGRDYVSLPEGTAQGTAARPFSSFCICLAHILASFLHGAS